MTFASVTPTQGHRNPLAGRRILFVEDEALVALDATQMLEEMGLSVVGPYASLEDGLAAARSEDFDIAMLDVNLRGEKSFTIAEYLSDRGIPFVFVTGYDQLDGFDDVPKLVKPYDDERIFAVLSSMLSERRGAA